MPKHTHRLPSSKMPYGIATPLVLLETEALREIGRSKKHASTLTLHLLQLLHRA